MKKIHKIAIGVAGAMAIMLAIKGTTKAISYYQKEIYPKHIAGTGSGFEEVHKVITDARDMTQREIDKMRTWFDDE